MRHLPIIKIVCVWAVIVGALGFLASGLSQYQFCPGTSVSPPPPLAFEFPRAPSSGWAGIMLDTMRYLVFGLAILTFFTALVWKEFRRVLLRQWPSLIVVFILTVMVLVAMSWLHPLFQNSGVSENAEVAGAPAAPSQGETSAEGKETLIPTPSAFPRWSSFFFALVAVFVLVGFLVLLLKSAGRQPEKMANESVSSRAEAKSEALQGVVMQCWSKMVDLLAPRAGLLPHLPKLTPRELAENLRARGIAHPAIDELTALFEEVRYGGRPDGVWAERACQALAALVEGYG